MRSLTALRASVLAFASVLSWACSWSVPADPGENARLRASVPRPEPAATVAAAPAASSDEGARLLYVERCGQCHAPHSPRHAAASEWPSYVRRYAPRAGLFGADRERVLRWLQANAR